MKEIAAIIVVQNHKKEFICLQFTSIFISSNTYNEINFLYIKFIDLYVSWINKLS